MGPALGLQRDLVISQIHQHRLAATDTTPQIDAAGRFRPAEKLRQQTIAMAQFRRETVNRTGRRGLLRIGLEFARRDQRGIGFSDFGHQT